MKNCKLNYKSIAQRDARDLAQVTPDVASRTARQRLVNVSTKLHKWKYAACLVLMVVLGVGEMWGVELGNGQYIYINYSTSTWGTASAKFKFNWYWNVGDYCCVDQEEGRVTGENYAYAQTQNAYTRAVQILRFNSTYSSQWNYTGTVAVSDATKNCITLTAAISDNYTFSWTTYAPPLSAVTLSDNGTSIVSGSGTSGDPYLVYVGAKIKVSGSGTKAVADPAATIYYNFKQSSTSKQNNTTSTYQFDASSTPNTTYTINLDGYTKVSSTSSTTKSATALYYKTIEVPASSHNITYTTESTGWTYGTQPSSEEEGETVTFVVTPAAGYTVSVTSSDVTLSGPNASNEYTFTMPDNDVAISVSATERKRNVTISVTPAGTGTLNKTSASVGVSTTTTVTATANTGYAFSSWTATNCSVASTTSSSTTLSGDGSTGSGTLVATFVPKWTIKGSGTEMGAWETFNNLSYVSGTTYRGTISLAANTTYEFKVVDRGANTWYGNSSAFVGQSSSLTMSSSNDANCKIATASAGTYTFEFDSDSKALTVSYPDEHPSANFAYVKDNSWTGPAKAYTYSEEVAVWANQPAAGSFVFDGVTYYYSAMGGNAHVIISDNGSEAAGKRKDVSSDLGKYWDFGSSSFRDFTLTITLDNKSATTAGTTSVSPVYKTEVLSDITVPEKTGYTFGGYYTAEGGAGSQLINASGKWQTVATYTDASKHWIKNTSVTLHAKWTEKTYTVTINNDGNGSTNKSGAQSSIGQVTGISLSVTPNDGKEFATWEIVSGTGSFASALTSGTNTFYPTSAATIRATFRSNRALTVSAGAHVTTVTGSVDPATLSSVDYTISATAFETGWEFNNWTAVPAANANIASSTSATTTTKVLNGSVTITANAKEKKVTLTTSNHYDAGNPSYTAPTKSVASIGIVTTSTITAPAAGTGYTFAGWTLSSNVVVTSGDKTTDRTITIRTNGTGTSATAQANYNEVLTSSWYINSDVNSPFTGWGTSGNRMQKKTGHSTEEIYYKTLTITSPGNYGLKMYNNDGDGNKYYQDKNNGGSSKSIDVGTCNGVAFDLDNANDKPNMTFKAYLAGDYEFKLDNTGSSPKLTVTWPVINQVRISAASPTDATNTNNFDLSDAVSNVRSKTLSLKANTTYTFKIVYNSDWYGYDSGTFTRSTSTSSNSRTLSTSGGDMTLTTDFAGDYTFKFNESTKALSIDFPTAYQVSLNVGTVKGNARTPAIYLNSVSDANKISNGTWVASGSKVLFWAANSVETVANAGYDWWGFYDNAAGTTPTQHADARVTIFTVNSLASTMNVYAVFGETDYGISSYVNGQGTITANNGWNAHIATKISFTANDGTGYMFSSWEERSGTALTIESPSSATTNVNATAAGTLQANFVPRYSVRIKTVGGSWCAADANLFTGYTTVSSKDVGYNSISLAANTTYEVQIFDRKTSTWYGGSSNQDIYYSNGGTEYTIATTASPKSVFVHSAAAGSYTLNWNLTDKKIAVTYPTSRFITSGQNDEDGGSFTAVDGSSNDVTGGKYVANNASVTFTATPNTGYTFDAWYTNEACTEGKNTSNPMTVSSITTDKSIYAKFNAKTYTVTLTRTGTGYSSGGSASVTATYNQTLPAATLPTAATGYAFMGYWSDEDGAGTQFMDASGNWIASIAGHTDGDKKWILDDDITLNAYFKKAEITALTFDNTSVETSSTVGVTPTISPTPTGDYKICWRVLHNNGNEISPQPEITWNGTKATFTSAAASGTYKVEAKLYTGTVCGSGTLLDTRLSSFQVAGVHNVTIQYKCGDEVLQASTVMTGRPLAWSDAINPADIFGYTFSGWTAGDGVTLTDDDGETTDTESEEETIKIKATYDGTLTANYTQRSLIFFKNTLGWSNVYVNFYTSSYWNNPKGSGNKNVTNKNLAMTRYGETDIWYYDYGAASITPTLYVSFTDASQDGSEFFWKNPNVNVVYPANYQDAIHTDKSAENGFKAATPMFVPVGDQEGTVLNSSGSGKATYFNRGYWTQYTAGTGYTLEIYNEAGNSRLKSIAFTSLDDLMPMKAVADLEGGATYKFQLRRGGTESAGIYYGNSGTMTHDNHGEGTAWDMTNSSFSMCGITTNASGDYVFHLSYSADGSNRYRLRIAVDYPVASGDYRILYTDAAKWSQTSAHGASWNHPSSVITKNGSSTETKADTVSLYVAYGSSPSAKFQKATVNPSTGAVTWADVASGTVSLSSITEVGVYNFIVTQTANGSAISLTKTEKYTGNYYIRTDCAGGGKWDNFRGDINHMMTYSDYAAAQSEAASNAGFTHYFVHWVTQGTNVKYTIANDYSQCISDTLAADLGTVIADISAGGNLNSASANIRFMWNQVTNKLSRAYINGSGYITDKFLVLEGDAKMFDEDENALTGANRDHRTEDHGSGATDYNIGADNQVILNDDQNFVYERTIKVQTGATGKLTAKYNNHVQYFIGTAEEAVELLGGDVDGKHGMRIVYDFKTNRLVTAYIPSGTISAELAIHADIMLVREHQEAGQQLTFSGSGKLSDVKTVYGVMRFNRWTLNNKSTADGHSPLGELKSAYERGIYWISFPFDVNLSDVFGFGTYGSDWIILEYDGAERAQKGYWADSEGFWKYITDRRGVTLEAGKGYVLLLDLDRMKDNDTEFWKNNIEQVELFFPSADNVGGIEATTATINVASHECTIAARPGQSDDRRKKDSHWNIIGVPSYANYGTTLKDGSNNTITWNENPATQNLPFLYEWNMVDNTYTAQSGTTYAFKTMHAYMVQYTGTLKWSMASATPPSAPARKTNATQDIEFRLELQQNEKTADQTFIKMTNDEEVSANFEFNKDLCKEMNSGKANIYTMVEGYIQTAGNCLPMTEQTTIVPVGVKIATNADYTFSIPEGTKGVGVVLIDNMTGERTNLSAVDYTVSLEEGTHDDRFTLEISPIRNVPTDDGGVESQKPKVESRKVLIDGLLYIVRDNKMYDARGARVE